MEWSWFTTPIGLTFFTSVAGFLGVLIGSFVSAWTISKVNKKKIDSDEKLAERRFEFDKDLAQRKIELDLKSQAWRRKQDLAEELIAGFHEIYDVMREVRSPLVFSGEGSTRPKGENETAEEARQLNRYYVIHERLNKNREPISRLLSKRYRAIASFGPKIAEPFDMLNQSINRTIIENELQSDLGRQEIKSKDEIEALIISRKILYGTAEDENSIAYQI